MSEIIYDTLDTSPSVNKKITLLVYSSINVSLKILYSTVRISVPPKSALNFYTALMASVTDSLLYLILLLNIFSKLLPKLIILK